MKTKRSLALTILLAICGLPGSGQAQQIVPAGPEPPLYDAPPVLVHEEPARYTAQGRNANVSGKVTVDLIVDVHGHAMKVHVVHNPISGLGLDETAVKAVHQDQFKPATKDGKPVAAHIKLEVPFDPAVNPRP
jgi:TonB family protein